MLWVTAKRCIAPHSKRASLIFHSLFRPPFCFYSFPRPDDLGYGRSAFQAFKISRITYFEARKGRPVIAQVVRPG